MFKDVEMNVSSDQNLCRLMIIVGSTPLSVTLNRFLATTELVCKY